IVLVCFFFFQAEDGIRDFHVTGVQTCALPIFFKGNIILVPTSPSFSWNKALVPTDFSTPFSKVVQTVDNIKTIIPSLDLKVLRRSEERRVGKECRSGRSRDQ